MNNKEIQKQFAWAVTRLAQMQGVALDGLALADCSVGLVGAGLQKDVLINICERMGFAKPKFAKRVDRVDLPLICHVDSLGWGLVVDRSPSGQWVVITSSGVREVDGAQLEGSIAIMQFKPSVDFGLGLFKSDDEKKGFAFHVRSVLFSYRRELLEACLASVFIGLLALGTSLFSMQVYDRVIPTKSEYTLVVLSVGVFISIVIELAMKFARSQVMDFVTVGIDSRLSREIFNQLMRLRVDQIPASVGSLASQLRGYEQLRGFYTSSTLFALIDFPLALVFILVIMLVASPWVALVPFVFGGISILVGLTIRKKMLVQARDGAKYGNLKTGLLVEAVEGVETIKAGAGAWKFLSRWISVNARTISSDLKMKGATESVGYLAASMQQISYALLVVVGAMLVMQGHMTMGALIASSILSGRILAPILAIPGMLVQHAHAQAALDGLERLYALKTDNHETEHALVPSSIRGHFQLSDIKFAYGDNPPSLVVPKLEIGPQECIAIVGPIGAGKSTLLKILSGMYQPQAGNVLLDGLDISHISRQVVSQSIGYLQQDHRLFQGTLRENLLIGLPDPGDDVLISVMRRTGMDKFVASHPRGLDRAIMEGGKGLSGGQKQLVAFTRLLLCRSSVLLLDEPTATMDEEQERMCLQVLAEEVKSGTSLVIVTHKSSVLQLVSRMIVVVGNTIVLDGPRDAVLQHMHKMNEQKQSVQAQVVARVGETERVGNE